LPGRGVVVQRGTDEAALTALSLGTDPPCSSLSDVGKPMTRWCQSPRGAECASARVPTRRQVRSGGGSPSCRPESANRRPSARPPIPGTLGPRAGHRSNCRCVGRAGEPCPGSISPAAPPCSIAWKVGSDPRRRQRTHLCVPRRLTGSRGTSSVARALRRRSRAVRRISPGARGGGSHHDASEDICPAVRPPGRIRVRIGPPPSFTGGIDGEGFRAP